MAILSPVIRMFLCRDAAGRLGIAARKRSGCRNPNNDLNDLKVFKDFKDLIA